MRSLRDATGLILVIVGLAIGGLVALVAFGPAPAAAPGAAQPPVPAAVSSPATSRTEPDQPVNQAERALGRTAFRNQCQECHIQGRQSFPPDQRGRAELLRTHIRQGGIEMPAFPPERLPDDTLTHVLTYLGTPAAPEPTPAPEPRSRGVNFEIGDVRGGPAEQPVVRFRIRDDAGTPIAPSEMAALNLTVGGPTVDYRWARREDARRAVVQDDGWAQYTFSASLPRDAAGTYAIATEGYRETAPAAPGGPLARETGFNAVAYFGVTDPTPVPPRQIVQIGSCNVCHGTLATHGGTRRNTEFCVMCHNATQTDEEKRAVAGGPAPPESVLFRSLIHRIHTGEDLAHPFVIYGGSPANPAPVDLGAVHPFPKDRANCLLCHEPGTYAITAALEQRAPMVTTAGGAIVRQVPPVTAACTGCHDADRTQAHAANQIAADGRETCAVCHGQGRPFSVTTVHRTVPQATPQAVPPRK